MLSLRESLARSLRSHLEKNTCGFSIMASRLFGRKWV
jgi:hypothetical protein